MSNRFTESEKWCDPWFRGLTPEFKLAWLYVLDICDCAGFFDLDIPLANFQIGMEVDWQRFFAQSCPGRIDRLTNGKYWIVKFVKFQQKNAQLSPANKYHKGVLKRFAENGISPTEFGYEIAKEESPFKGASKVLGRCPGNSNSNSKGNRRVLYSEDFETFWNEFPSGRRTGKKGAFDAWKKAILDTPPERIICAAKEYASSDVGNGEFVKSPAPWLNQGCWDDDRNAWKEKSSKTQTKDDARRIA